MKVNEYNQMMAYMLRPRQKFAIGGGVIEGEDLGTREGYVEPKLIIGGSRTAPEFRGKFGVRTLVTVPEDTPGYLGRTGEQVVFETKADANRFVKQDLDALVAEGRITKEARPAVAKTAAEINNFVNDLIKKGNKKIYLNDIIDEFEGTKSIYDPNKNLSRKEIKVRIKQALPKNVYDKLIKTTGTDPRITAEKKVKFNKLVLDVNRGDLPIIALGSEARGTTTNIKPYLTEANKKRFDKILPKLRAINSRISQPREIYTANDIKIISQTTTKTFDKMTKNFPTSIEARTQVFKGGTRFYDAKSFALAQIGRHVQQGGTLYKHVGGDTMKDVKFRNTKTNKLITIRNIDMNSPEFKEAGETYKDFEKLKNTQIDNPLTGEKISINEAIRQGSDGKDYLVVDHGDGIKNNPLKNLIITSQKQNIGFQLANLTEDQKKLFYRNKLSLDDNIKRFTNYGQRLLAGGAYKTPKQTVADLIAKGEITTADKAPIPEATQTRNMFKNAFKGAGKLGVAAVPAYYLGTGIKKEISEGRNPFSMSVQAAETGQMPQGSPAQINQDKSLLEEYPYLVGTTAAASPLLTKKGRKIYGGVLKGGLKAFGSVPVGLGFSASQFADINPFSDDFGELKEDPNLAIAGVDLLLPELGKRIPGSSSGRLAQLGRFALNPFQVLEGLGRFGKLGRFAAMGARIPSLMTPAGILLTGGQLVKEAMDEQDRINLMRETDPEAYQEYLAEQEDLLGESA